MPTIAIDSEDIAWETLNGILQKKIDVDDLQLDFSNADWLSFDFKLKGDKFESSLTYYVMKGLSQYQLANYRAVALTLNSNPNATSLNDEQRDKYELIFKIAGGSTETRANGKDIVDGLKNDALTAVVNKMGRRTLFVLILTVAVLYFGSGVYSDHVKSTVEVAKSDVQKREIEAKDRSDERRQRTIDELIASDREKNRILERAVKSSQTVSKVVMMHDNAIDVLLKNTSGADYIELQSRKITREELDQINKQTRRRSSDIFLDREFIIRGVEPHEDGTFTVRVEDAESGDGFPASLADPISIQKSKSAIQFAEWNQKPVRIQINAKDKGEGPYEAEIVRAFRQKKKKQ